MHQQSATNAFETASKRGTQKTAEATGDLIGNKIADIITKVLNKIIQREMRIIEKYLKKNASLQKTENIVVRQNIDRK